MSKKRPVVSVLLSVYNPDRNYLYDAVRSIKRQTMTEWELLLYDDGSDEEHARAVWEVACMDKRIQYYRSNRHHSLAYGLNKLLNYAAGKYIARMDGDDVCHPERLRKSYEFLETHPEYDWVGCNTFLMDMKDDVWGTRKMPEIPQKEDFLSYSPYIHPAVMFRSEVVKSAGYMKSDKMRRGEDYELFMRLHAGGARGYNLQEVLFSYREDIGCYKRRNFRCQLEEVRIRWHGFKELKIRMLLRFVYTVKPLVVWMVPDTVVWMKKQYSNRKIEYKVARW